MKEIIQHWPEFKGLTSRAIDVGLINETWFLGDPPCAVLQKVHPIFGPEVHQDIEALTKAVAEAGLATPRLIPTRENHLCHVDEERGLWRVLTFVPGVTHEVMQGQSMAYEAGKLVGQWHRAMDPVQHEFHFQRVGVHDTDSHMEKLVKALENHSKHRLHPRVEEAASEVLLRWERWDGNIGGALRIAHGDLKLSNLRFNADGEGVCLLDLDTMGRLSLDVELGDAWRSWCNQAGEDQQCASFNLEFFEASVRGYVSARPLKKNELEGLEWGTERIALELAARFLLDALEETYFGWDSSKFTSRGDHNLVRGQGQLSLARDLASKRAPMRAILMDVGQGRT